MSSIVRYLDGFWFEKAPAERPAILRILVGLWTLYYLGVRYRMIMTIAASDPRLFKPVGVAKHLNEPVPVGVVRGTYFATMISCVAFTLGWKHRQTGPAFAALFTWLMCYRNSWSMIYHNDNALVLHAIILGVAPSSDALSLDSLSRKSPPEVHWRYGWPAKMMSTMTVLTYFLAGVAKLAGPLGRSWTDGEALRSQIAVDGLRKELLGEGASPFVARLYRQKWLFQGAGLGSLVLEAGAPLFLADKRLARLWAVGAFGMHWGIYFIMNIKFRYQMTALIFASFFDLDVLLKRLIRSAGTPE